MNKLYELFFINCKYIMTSTIKILKSSLIKNKKIIKDKKWGSISK